MKRRCLILFVFQTIATLSVYAQTGSSLTYASSLQIDSSCDHSTLVTITDAWPDAPPLEYALVERGGPVPDSAGFDTVISIPVRRIVSLSSTTVPHIRDLGMIDRLVAVDNGDHIYDAALHRRIESGTVAEVGSGDSLNLERIITVRPDVALISAMGPDDPTLQRLRAAGIPVIVLADWREQDPLGRAEWIRLLGVLLGRDAAAQSLFTERVGRYHEVARRSALVPAAERPTVLLNAPWQGTWPVPGGDSYIARIFIDAGATYPWADQRGAGSLFLDLESVLSLASTADYWFNLNYGWRTLDDVPRADPRLTVFAPYQTGRMYHYIGRVQPWGANDFWESGASRPDLVLSDLVHILHPRLLPDHDPVYYRRLP